MKNKIIYIFLGVVVVFIFIIVFILMKQSPLDSKLQTDMSNLKTKLKQCPDEWIDNQMPSIGPEKIERQYFILNGERREIDEFDMEWIQKNCGLRKQRVF